MPGCVPGLAHRWLWFDWPERDMPDEGDIGIVGSTGSCYLVQSIKPSRKGSRWFSIRVEGLGVDAAELGDEGTFGLGRISRVDLEAIRMIEAADRLDAAA